MKSFSTIGLILLVSAGWLVSQAHAQSGDFGAPTLLPMPEAAPALSAPATYNDNYDGTETFDSALTSRKQQDALPEPAVPANAPKAPDVPAGPADAATSNLWDDCGCNACNESCGRWFGSLGGLVMGRNRANPFWTTFQTNVNTNQLMNTQNAGANWAGGGQVTVGYGFGGCGCDECGSCGGCGCAAPAIAFTYWGVGQMRGFSEVTDPNNNLSTPINLNTQSGPVQIGANPASFFFDNSPDQRIWRNDRFSNFELNLLQGVLVNTGRLQMTALAGFRYFRFDERLTYGSVAFGHNFGDQGGADEAYLGFHTTNNLFGGQIGASFNYILTPHFNLFFTPKVGIYGNQMTNQTLLYSGDAINNPTYNISAHKTDVSFLGEIDTGFNWAINRNWSAYMGYRVIGVAGLALGDNQFLPFLADTQGFSEIKQNGDMILHGAFAGITCTF
jgi:Putative beta barrel porin-7 (BBP7)